MFASQKSSFNDKTKSSDCFSTSADIYCYHPCSSGVISKTNLNDGDNIYILTRKMKINTPLTKTIIKKQKLVEIADITISSFAVDLTSFKTISDNCNVEIQNVLLLDDNKIELRCGEPSQTNICSSACNSKINISSDLTAGTRYLVKLTNSDKIYYFVTSTTSSQEITTYKSIDNTNNKIDIIPYQSQLNTDLVTCKVILQVNQFVQNIYCGGHVCYLLCGGTFQTQTLFPGSKYEFTVITSGIRQFSKISDLIIPEDKQKIVLKKEIISMNEIKIVDSTSNVDKSERCFYIVYSYPKNVTTFKESCYNDDCNKPCNNLRFTYDLKQKHKIRIIPKTKLLSEEIIIPGKVNI